MLMVPICFLAHLCRSTGRTKAVTMASESSSTLHKILKFLVSLLIPWMDQVDTLPDVKRLV